MASVISSEEERREKSCSAFSHVGARSPISRSAGSVEMTVVDFCLIFSTRNLNLSGLMKLSLSSCLSPSIPATASNPKGFPSTLVNLSTSRGGMTFVSHGFPVLGGVHESISPVSPQFHFGDPLSLERGFEN